jgi:hypothetical protein
VRGQKIGRDFEVKVSSVTEPAESAARSVLVYATSSGESGLIRQAKYAAAVGNAPGCGHISEPLIPPDRKGVPPPRGPVPRLALDPLGKRVKHELHTSARVG